MRILVIEDDALIRRIVVRIIEGMDHTVMAAGTYAEAVEGLKTGIDLFDAVVSDFNLDMGSTAADVFAETGLPKELVMMSGRAEDIPGWVQKKACMILKKPFDFDQIRDMVHFLGARVERSR